MKRFVIIHRRQIGRALPQSPALLPQTAPISLPAGLDWVIRQRLTSVIAAQLISGESAALLLQLDAALTRSGRRDIYQAQLYGYELSLLYSFLLRQERTYRQWWSELIPDQASRTIRAQLRGFLPQLHRLCRQVDLYADRPL